MTAGAVPSRGHAAARAIPYFNHGQAPLQLVLQHFSLVRLGLKHVLRALKCEFAGQNTDVVCS